MGVDNGLDWIGMASGCGIRCGYGWHRHGWVVLSGCFGWERMAVDWVGLERVGWVGADGCGNCGKFRGIPRMTGGEAIHWIEAVGFGIYWVLPWVPG